MPQEATSPIKYIDAGVDSEKAALLIKEMGRVFNRTKRIGALNSPCGFAGLFELPIDKYRHPILLSATDGVGTKLVLTRRLEKYDTIGIDLVAMCVNDILVHGGKPLVFLDYYACGKLESRQAQAVMEGIAKGCLQADAELNGGETAEMPTVYGNGEYDIAGFAVGIAEKDMLLPYEVAAGDVVVGIPSSGVHANGFSLINHIISAHKINLNEPFGDTTLGETLLTPTCIYVKALSPLIEQKKIAGLAHITGGGITDNLPRVLPANHCAEINPNAWARPAIFDWIQKHTYNADDEMLRTFNCGIGMCAIVKEAQKNEVLKHLDQCSLPSSVIGEIVKQEESEPRVVYI